MELPVIQQQPGPHEPPFVKSASTVRYDDGFYAEEHDGLDPFRWMAARGVLAVEPSPESRYLELSIASEFGDLSQTLAVHEGERDETLELPHHWVLLSVAVSPGSERIVLETNKLYPPAYYPGDERELAIRVRGAFVHTDPARHASVRRQWDNHVLNTREMLEGKLVLESTPPKLGIDLHGQCNVKPPCVYCEWDDSKDKEGDNVDVPFTLETLKEYGAFFDNTSDLQNCSVGEPFMMRQLDELLDVFGNEGKSLEMSTNGQILTERNIAKLLGRNIHLYISLDAATPETYRRLRNDTFERILANIRRLSAAKKAHGKDLPKVSLVFMPMRANVDELEAFVSLCRDVGADRLVLRPLNTTLGNDLVWDRDGYHFDYDAEILPFPELVKVSGRAAAICKREGVELSDQLDFGGELENLFEAEYHEGEEQAAPRASEAREPKATPEPTPEPAPEPQEPPPSLGLDKRPICVEPWTSLFVLRRGVLPCSYGYEEIAEMDGYRDAWNSELLQQIRASLREGQLHRYCVASRSCPILRKWESAHRLSFRQQARLWLFQRWLSLNALTGDVPRTAWRTVKSLFKAAPPR